MCGLDSRWPTPGLLSTMERWPRFGACERCGCGLSSAKTWFRGFGDFAHRAFVPSFFIFTTEVTENHRGPRRFAFRHCRNLPDVSDGRQFGVRDHCASAHQFWIVEFCSDTRREARSCSVQKNIPGLRSALKVNGETPNRDTTTCDHSDRFCAVRPGRVVLERIVTGKPISDRPEPGVEKLEGAFCSGQERTGT